MRSARLGLAAVLLLGSATAEASRVVAGVDNGQSSLSIFPSELSIDLQRGESVEQPIGITQTGAPQRMVRFEITGDAAAFVSLVDDASGAAISSLTVADNLPAYVRVRVAPHSDVLDGEHVARIRIVADGGLVTLGSELRVNAQVSGDNDLRARLLAAEVVGGRIEVGRPVRLRLDVDADGTTPIEPVISVHLESPQGVVSELEARPEAPEPGNRATVEAAWSTAGWDLGRHRGEVALLSRGTEIGRLPISVEIVSAGSLASALSLISADVTSTARPNEIVSLSVRVRNDGEATGSAAFVGDLLFGTDIRSAVRSEPVTLAPGETAELLVHGQLGEAGTYRVRGRAVMQGAETGTIAVEFDATEPGGRPWQWIALASVGALVLGAIAIRRRH